MVDGWVQVVINVSLWERVVQPALNEVMVYNFSKGHPLVLGNFHPVFNFLCLGKVEEKVVGTQLQPWIKWTIWTLFNLDSGLGTTLKWHWSHLLMTFGKLDMDVMQPFWPPGPLSGLWYFDHSILLHWLWRVGHERYLSYGSSPPCVCGRGEEIWGARGGLATCSLWIICSPFFCFQAQKPWRLYCQYLV